MAIIRKNSNQEFPKEIEISTQKIIKKLEKLVIASNSPIQEPSQVFSAQETDNVIGIKAPYRIRDKNYYFALRLENYVDCLAKINFSNMLFVTPLQRARPHQIYKYHVMKGNNHMVIKNALKQRWWWQSTEIGDNKNYDNINFLWSPWRINKFLDTLKKHNYESLSNTSSTLMNPKDASKSELLFSSNDDHCSKWAKSKLYEKKQGKDMESITSLQIHLNLKKVLSNVDMKHQSTYEGIINLINIDDPADQRNQKFIDEYKKIIPNYSKHQFCRVSDTLSSRIYNHLENNFLLSDKKALFLSLRHYYVSQKLDPFDFIPLTFHIRKHTEDPEYTRFQEYYGRIKQDPTLKNIWIVKPGENTNRGVGITVCEKLEEIEDIIKIDTLQANGKPQTYIVQKYIERPLLYQKRKFDIRCYVLITSINGIQKGYWYQDGYIRTSSNEYSLENMDKQIHLTNDAIQKKCEEYGKHESGNKVRVLLSGIATSF